MRLGNRVVGLKDLLCRPDSPLSFPPTLDLHSSQLGWEYCNCSGNSLEKLKQELPAAFAVLDGGAEGEACTSDLSGRGAAEMGNVM